MMKRIFALLMMAAVLCALPLTAFAHDYVQMDKTDCSIEVEVYYKGKPVHGGTLSAIKMGYVDEDDGNYFFRRVGDDALLEDIQSTDALTRMLIYYGENINTVPFEKKTVDVKRGYATFTDLTPGLYLMLQEKAAPGYYNLKPFLVSVPYMEDGKYVYNLTAVTKSQLEQENETVPPTTKPPRIPQTGQMNWPVPVMASAGLLVFALGWALFNSKRKDTHA